MRRGAALFFLLVTTPLSPKNLHPTDQPETKPIKQHTINQIKKGGESVYGAPFRDEFHSRLRFSHRGLVACANANAPHTNGSQFFITLDKAEWLDKKNTIFGRVAGDTVYNLAKLNDYEVDEDDRPLEPPRILVRARRALERELHAWPCYSALCFVLVCARFHSLHTADTQISARTT